MSADNGIYILRSPIRTGHFEYRVAHLQAIENIDYDRAHEILYFGKCQVFHNRDAAWKEALKIYDSIDGVLEYGISQIDSDHPFPKMSIEEARNQLNCWSGYERRTL